MTFFHNLISFSDIFCDNLVCLFLVPVPAAASAHTRTFWRLCGVDVFS